jgi:hypothetical protein
VTHGLTALALAVSLAGVAHAGPAPNANFSTAEPRTQTKPTVSVRLVQDSEFDPDPMHHSGIVGRTDIAPNASLGLGLLKAAPKRRAGNWNSDRNAPLPRKGLVSFLLKF